MSKNNGIFRFPSSSEPVHPLLSGKKTLITPQIKSTWKNSSIQPFGVIFFYLKRESDEYKFTSYEKCSQQSERRKTIYHKKERREEKNQKGKKYAEDMWENSDRQSDWNQKWWGSLLPALKIHPSQSNILKCYKLYGYLDIIALSRINRRKNALAPSHSFVFPGDFAATGRGC